MVNNINNNNDKNFLKYSTFFNKNSFYIYSQD